LALTFDSRGRALTPNQLKAIHAKAKLRGIPQSQLTKRDITSLNDEIIINRADQRFLLRQKQKAPRPNQGTRTITHTTFRRPRRRTEFDLAGPDIQARPFPQFGSFMSVEDVR
jgi:hypothetical protein